MQVEIRLFESWFEQCFCKRVFKGEETIIPRKGDIVGTADGSYYKVVQVEHPFFDDDSDPYMVDILVEDCTEEMNGEVMDDAED